MNLINPPGLLVTVANVPIEINESHLKARNSG